ncbi:Pentatricopeptide repeat-containing protein [Dendrobium catenatum]|uniref:Pentatricopeptide repeat-containing protein n=1 Tax=Dendrobium catenatum TaxID=906689 RepID=A0A2I0V968_9ASPA|nr:Pentatricopeptide repeat-containing protein [Dendrobium catenatum]
MAVLVLREMEGIGIQLDNVSLSTLLAACGRCGQIVKINSILSMAKSLGIELNTVAHNLAIGSYMAVGNGSCKLEKFNDFFEFLDEMKELNVPLSKEVYSSVIYAYIKQGNLAEAEKTFAMMKATGCMPDVITYTSMINAYRITDDWKKAWDVFVEMRVNNIKPDPIACSALMEALNRGCQSAMVLQLPDAEL